MTCLLFFGLFLNACSSSSSSSISPEFMFVNASTKKATDTSTFSCLGGSNAIQIVSNTNWKVESNATWCTLSKYTGNVTDASNTAVIQILATPNSLSESRNAILTLQAGEETKELKVIQYGKGAKDASGWELSTTAAYDMRPGINLGNSLDSYGSWITSKDPSVYETAWGHPIVTKELIQAIKAGGFNTVRVPVTWGPHMDTSYQVYAPWMNRVEEVVKYVLDAGMYCILNVHHDTGSDTSAWLRADLSNYSAISTKYAALWKQIATRFAAYGDKLLFEGYNEMLDAKSDWNTTDANSYKALNQLAQVFVSTVRSTGGNNVNRNLILCTYSAATADQTLASFTMPDDEVPFHLIAEVHDYTPNVITMPEKGTSPTWQSSYGTLIDAAMTRMDNRFTKQGVPFFIGECGVDNSVVETELNKYADYYSKALRSHDITAMWWFDLIDRTTYEWKYPTVKTDLINAAKP